MLLLDAEISKVVIDFGKRRAFLVHLLIAGLTLAKDAERTIVAIAYLCWQVARVSLLAVVHL